MKGLDLSKFKKVSEGEDRTTLQHPDGHEIVIAHVSLSPKMLSELKKLGTSGPRMMAEGGAPTEAPKKDDLKGRRSVWEFGEPDEPIKTSKNAAPGIPPSTQTPTGPTDMDSTSPASVPTKGPTSPATNGIATKNPGKPGYANNDVADSSIITAQEPKEAPTAPIIPPPPPEPLPPEPPPPPPPTFEQVRQENFDQYQTQSKLFGDDLWLGHITPQTYSSLYAEKGTLGKIGSVFGMLLSGWGSGLSGQPNAFMEIMQKQIDNDLAAQKQSASNAQNFYQMNLQRQLNEAEILRKKADQLMIEASTQKIPAEIAKMKADQLMVEASTTKIPQERELLIAQANQMYEQAKKTEQEALTTEETRGKIPLEKKVLVAEANRMYQEANRLKQTAQLDATTNASNQAMLSAFNELRKSPYGQTPEGQQALAVMFSRLEKVMADKNAAAAGMKAFTNVTAGSAQKPEAGTPVPTVDYNKMNMLERGGIMPASEVSAANAEAEMIENANIQQRIYQEAFQHLNTLAAGKMTPAFREAEIQKLAKFMTPEQAEAFMPGPADRPDTRENKYKAGMKHFESKRAGTPILKKRGLISQPAAQQKPEQPKQTKEGATGTTKDGKKVIFKGGKWVPNK